MRCEECLPLVEDYFDGELDEQTNDFVAQHINACASCASLYHGLEGDQQIYLLYECDAQPSTDFWENVMSRVAAAAPAKTALPARPLSAVVRDWLGRSFAGFNARRFSPSLTALLVLVAIGVTIGVMRFSNSKEEPAGPASIAQNSGPRVTTPLPPAPDAIAGPADSKTEGGMSVKGSEPDAKDRPPVTKVAGRREKGASATGGNAVRINPRPQVRTPTPDQLVREAEQKYVAAIAMLSRDVNRRRSRLDPETIARFERTLAAVDRNIADTRQAARRNPDDPVAAQYMLTAYAKKVDVLREMVGY